MKRLGFMIGLLLLFALPVQAALQDTLGTSTTDNDIDWIGNSGTPAAYKFTPSTNYTVTSIDFYITEIQTNKPPFNVSVFNGTTSSPGQRVKAPNGSSEQAYFSIITTTGTKTATFAQNVTCLSSGNTYWVVFAQTVANSTGNYFYRMGETTGTDVHKYCTSGATANPENCTSWGGFSGGGVSTVNIKIYGDVVGSCASVATASSITQSTYNLTSAYANSTAWRQNVSFPVPTIDTTPTVTFDTNIAAYCRIHTQDQNWTAMGGGRNCTTTGGTSHTCSLGMADAYTPSVTPQELHIGCIDSTYTYENSTSTSGPLNISIAGVSENEGRTAITVGLDASEIAGGYTSYTDRQIVAHISNGSQYHGRFDVFVVSGNKRWAFNYDQLSASAFPTFTNVTPVFWFWESALATPASIAADVSAFINATN